MMPRNVNNVNILPTMDNIYSLISKIRDFINQPRVKEELLKNMPLFNQLCSCMDMLEDSQSAIDSFALHKDENAGKGHVYLEIFGLLQALFVQQDATTDIAEALQFEISLDQYPRLKEIREIRNDTSGHPTKRGFPNKPPVSWNSIVQYSAGYDGFEVMRWHNPVGHTKITVKTKEVIIDQQKHIIDILQKIYNEIKRRDNEYKSKFKMKKVEDIFHGTIGYMCEKMYNAVSRRNELNLGEMGAITLQNILVEFESELKNRDIAVDTYPGIGLTFNELKYPLEKLKLYFTGEIDLDEEEATIFVTFVRGKMDELKKMAKELDDEFAEE